MRAGPLSCSHRREFLRILRNFGEGELSNPAFVVGCAIALLVAVAAIYVDCYQRLSKLYPNVPTQFFTSVPMLLLAFACGITAAIAFYGTDPKGTGYIDKLLSLSIENVYTRGLYVGALVLVLIRSKLFQLQGADIGGEFFYNLGSQKAINSVVLRWIEWRDAFVDRVLPKTYLDPNFDDTMLGYMKAIAAATADAKYRSDIEAQIQKIEQSKPAGAVSAVDPNWQRYYRTITRMTLEVCGTRPLKKLG
jgi:hypothetical protein